MAACPELNRLDPRTPSRRARDSHFDLRKQKPKQASGMEVHPRDREGTARSRAFLRVPPRPQRSTIERLGSEIQAFGAMKWRLNKQWNTLNGSLQVEHYRRRTKPVAIPLAVSPLRPHGALRTAEI